MTYITLNDGNKIPQLGLGIYMIQGDPATERACTEALALGYRHIDTAHAYQNERGVGAAVKKSGISREEIWITTKLWPSEYGEGKTRVAIDKMLERLSTDYIDLLLLHQQFGDYMSAWQNMQQAVKVGKVRSIGISNFESNRLEEICEATTIKPSVLQVECHPYYAQHALKKRIEKYGTVVESRYPIRHGDKHLINEPVFTCLAKKYGKTNVQIILRWQIQEGNIVFPKTTNPEHMQSNIDIFDFTLTIEEMAEIAKLDQGRRYYNVSPADQEKMLGAWKHAD